MFDLAVTFGFILFAAASSWLWSLQKAGETARLLAQQERAFAIRMNAQLNDQRQLFQEQLLQCLGLVNWEPLPLRGRSGHENDYHPGNPTVPFQMLELLYQTDPLAFREMMLHLQGRSSETAFGYLIDHLMALAIIEDAPFWMERLLEMFPEHPNMISLSTTLGGKYAPIYLNYVTGLAVLERFLELAPRTQIELGDQSFIVCLVVHSRRMLQILCSLDSEAAYDKYLLLQQMIARYYPNEAKYLGLE